MFIFYIRMPRRRLSSDGLGLFNVAMHMAPRRSKIKQLLSCFFRTDYDDRLEAMVDQCRVASKQLYSYQADPILKKKIKKYIDNSIFNVIYAVLSKDKNYANRFEIKQNYRYFKDVMEKAHDTGDQNTVVMLKSALDHYALKQMKIKPRKKDIEMEEVIENEYGTWTNCYKHHLHHVMEKDGFDEDTIPSMMVLQMHVDRCKAYTKAFDAFSKTKMKYTPDSIEGKMGLYALHHIVEKYNKEFPLYNEPKTKSSTELIEMAQKAN